MMLAWSFAARTAPEVGALLSALGRHRYVREVDHRLHFTVDLALSDDPAFAGKAVEWQKCLREERIEPDSRDPRLWRPASLDEVKSVLATFWSVTEAQKKACDELVRVHEKWGVPMPAHRPFESDPDDPPHPELVLCDWVLHPVDELDPERHAGAMNALEASGEEVDVSEPVFQEAGCIALPELCSGAREGALVSDFVVWSDGAYAYADYVFRGAARASKLAAPPVGRPDSSDD